MVLLSTEPRPAEAHAGYEADTVAWALRQEALLREGRAEALDWPHLDEEIADVADTQAWTARQTDLLRRRRFAELDRSRLADEIADVARRDYLRLRSALMQILQHLLKWDHQPERRSRSWALSIAEHRERAKLLLAEHPSLAGRRTQALEVGYRISRIAALRDTGLPQQVLPEINPYTWDVVVARPVAWPEPDLS